MSQVAAHELVEESDGARSAIVTPSTGVRCVSRARSRGRSDPGLASTAGPDASEGSAAASEAAAPSGSLPLPKAPPPPRLPGGPASCPGGGAAPSPVVPVILLPLFWPQARARSATASREREGKDMRWDPPKARL